MQRHRNSKRKNTGSRAKREADRHSRGLKLLPYAIRENLPILGSQQHKGGKAKAIARCCTTDGSCAWYITEGSARRNPEGKAMDYLLYGLIEGDRRTLEYFWLSDLVTIRSSTAMLVQRDLQWRPKSLDEIAPEIFTTQEKEQED
jgi:hypothetical protein